MTETTQPSPPDPPDLRTALRGDTLPDEAVLQRAEEKPPMYRLFRLAMYVSYMVVVVWFVVSIVVGVWASVWGQSGQALRAQEPGRPPVPASSVPASSVPASAGQVPAPASPVSP